MEEIRDYFNNIIQQTEEEWLFFLSKLERKELPKKTLLLKVGQTENYLSFIEKGIVRFFVPTEEAELTFDFAFENDFVSAYDSFLSRLPSIYNLETLSETILWRISYQDLQKIYDETSVGNKIGRYASETLYREKSTRELSLLFDTAEQRYLKLFTERPQLFEKIPLKYIASYIGITPQALSRIRRRIC